MEKTVDFIIIGQGLAGTALMQSFYERGFSFVMIDQVDDHQASRVASGIWNPIVLKRMKKVWQADAMLEVVVPFYQRAEELLQASFIDTLHVNRVFAEKKEIDEWLTLCDQPSFSKLIDAEIMPTSSIGINDRNGSGVVRSSGRIKTAEWLNAARSWLIKNRLLLEEQFDFVDLKRQSSYLEYRNIRAKGIVFCEGMHAATSNPYFSYLPFALTKGEVLIIECKALELNAILNSSIFVLPLGNDLFKIGATYNWRNVDLNQSEQAEEELVAKAKRIIQVPFEVVGHKVGIRPTVKDRKPLIGTHPQHPKLHIFNGMGSRGVLMAPWLSKVFVSYLEGTEALPVEADIKRFDKFLV